MRTRQAIMPRRYSRMGIDGDGSTLNLDFTTMGALDSRFTFTRSTTATYVNSLGYVASAAINEARFDYNPTTLAAKGLLIEGAATNLLKFSAYADTNWLTAGGYTKSYTTGITSPANDSTAVKVTFSATGHGLYSNGTLMGYTNSVGSVYTWSAWIRATVNTTNLNIRLGDSNATLPPNTAITTTWTRYSYSYTATSNSGPYLASASGTATGEFEMWGFQLEIGTGASSYIPTTTAQVTRALDSCIMSGTNFSSWFNAAQGTLLTTWSGTSISSGRYATINDGSTSNQIWTGFSESAIYNGSFQASFGTATSTSGKVAIAYALNDAAWCTNGGAVSTDATVTLPTGLNQITFGANASGGAQVNTALRNIKFFPTRQTSAQLIAITT